MDSESAGESAKCFKCEVLTKRKKLRNCSDCGESFCKNHIKLNESDFSLLCTPCLKKRVHLEISMEMEAEILTCKSELRDVRTRLKKSKDDLEKCEENIEEFASNLKKSKKKHQKNIKKLQKQEKELENQVDWNEFNKVTEEHQQKNENFQLLFNRCQQITQEVHQNTREVDSLQEDLIDFAAQLNELTKKNKKLVAYTVIRTLCCEICKNLIKKQFADDILKGFAGNNSVISSILHKDSEKSIRYSLDGKHKKGEKEVCNCLIV